MCCLHRRSLGRSTCRYPRGRAPAETRQRRARNVGRCYCRWLSTTHCLCRQSILHEVEVPDGCHRTAGWQMKTCQWSSRRSRWAQRWVQLRRAASCSLAGPLQKLVELPPPTERPRHQAPWRDASQASRRSSQTLLLLTRSSPSQQRTTEEGRLTKGQSIQAHANERMQQFTLAGYPPQRISETFPRPHFR